MTRKTIKMKPLVLVGNLEGIGMAQPIKALTKQYNSPEFDPHETCEKKTAASQTLTSDNCTCAGLSFSHTQHTQ